MKEFFDAMGKAARTIIAFAITIMSFGFLYFLLYKKIPAENKDVVQITAGIVLGVLATVVSYYFGSSKDKSDSDKADRVIETAVQAQSDKEANK